jgi:hypothetical protein
LALYILYMMLILSYKNEAESPVNLIQELVLLVFTSSFDLISRFLLESAS